MPSPPALVESTDGVGVAVHDLGGVRVPAGAPVVLLVHANGFNAGSWRPLAAALAASGHRAVAVDLRGHGLARTPDGLDFAWSGFGDDVVAVLDSGVLPPGPLHGVGHSLGGAALAMAAARRPGAFRSLWLFEPITPPPMPDFPRSSNPLADGAERRRATFESLAAAYDNYASKPPMSAFHPDALRGYVEGGFEPLAEGGVALRCRPAWEATIFRMTHGNPGWASLPSIDVPVTVVMGADEPFGPSSWATRVADELPRGRLVQHPELSHFGPQEAPDRLAAEVAAWIAGG